MFKKGTMYSVLQTVSSQCKEQLIQNSVSAIDLFEDGTEQQ